jgi:hypothetical protein
VGDGIDELSGDTEVTKLYFALGVAENIRRFNICSYINLVSEV